MMDYVFEFTIACMIVFMLAYGTDQNSHFFIFTTLLKALNKQKTYESVSA